MKTPQLIRVLSAIVGLCLGATAEHFAAQMMVFRTSSGDREFGPNAQGLAFVIFLAIAGAIYAVGSLVHRPLS